jgi:tetratricopeptide (TPR) repeat protein
MRTIRPLLLVATAALVLAWVRPVVAEPDRAKARTLVDSAVDLAREGKYQSALELFQKAYAEDPAPVLLYNIGQVRTRLGDLPGAREALERYLREETKPAGLERGRAALDEVLARWPGSLRVLGGGTGALVELDGRPVGRTPLVEPLAVEPGRHRLRLTAERKLPLERDVDVPAGKAVEVLADLLDEPAPVAPAAPAAPAAQVAPDRTWLWVLVGSGAALLVAGGVTAGVLLANRGGSSPSPDVTFTLARPTVTP